MNGWMDGGRPHETKSVEVLLLPNFTVLSQDLSLSGSQYSHLWKPHKSILKDKNLPKKELNLFIPPCPVLHHHLSGDLSCSSDSIRRAFSFHLYFLCIVITNDHCGPRVCCEEQNVKIKRQPPGRPMRASREHEKHIREALGALSDKIWHPTPVPSPGKSQTYFKMCNWKYSLAHRVYLRTLK